jgi:DNA-binding transcriptional LysR family regulator
MDHILAMRAFVKVVEAGTFTHAAQTLRVGTPTVSRLVQSLERHLQVRLLQRSTRAIALTNEGESYYKRVVRLLADLADVESSMKQSAATPSGLLHVDCVAPLGTFVLVPALPQFHRSFPHVSVRLRSVHRLSQLIAEGVDCAVVVGEISEQSLVARRIGEMKIATCATPEFLAANGAPESPAAIDSVGVIRLYSEHTGRVVPLRFANEARPLEVVPTRGLLVNDCHACLAAGHAGLGLMQVPAIAVRPALASGKLVEVMEDWRPASVPVHLVYPPNRYLSAKVRVFMDWVVGVFRSNPDLRMD